MALPRIVNSLLALAILQLSTHPVLAARCTLSHDCDDAVACTFDFCEPTLEICYNIAQSSSLNCTTPVFNTTVLQVAKQAQSLSVTEKLNIIDTATTLFRDVNPHRNLHVNVLRVDPVIALAKLARRVKSSNMTDFDFHTEMVSIFSSVGDLHNFYKLPAPFSTTAAFIPITLSEYHALNGTTLELRYLVGDVAHGFTFANPNFTSGVEITSWNGIPVSTAISKTIANFAGTDREAAVVRGMRLLTRRFLGTDLAPKQSSVTIGFLDAFGHAQSVVVPWIYTSVPSKEHVDAEDKLSDHVFAELVPTVSGSVQVIRVRDFAPSFLAITDFLAEFRRLILAPSSKIGVVIDVRGTRGGYEWLAPQAVSVLTSRYILSSQYVLRTTKFMLAAARSVRRVFVPDLATTPLGVPSPIDLSEQLGDQFFGRSALFSKLANSYTGPRYTGPVIALTDAETYGTGETFVAAAKDNFAALIVGVNAATGGGGSTVFSSEELSYYLPNMMPRLPGGVVMNSAVFRVERTGPFNGVPIEHFGIRPDVRYFASKQDVVQKDSNLMVFLGRKLTEMSCQSSPEPQLTPDPSPDIVL